MDFAAETQKYQAFLKRRQKYVDRWHAHKEIRMNQGTLQDASVLEQVFEEMLMDAFERIETLEKLLDIK